MSPAVRERRVAMLAPMEPELAPLTRHLGLVPDDDGVLHRARHEGIEIIATVTTMGMEAGARATQLVLDVGVDRVIVVGVAGGIDPDVVAIGDLVVPAEVVDRRTGTSYGPPHSPHVAPAGIISCGDDLITDPAGLGHVAATGAIALDMETAAVAAVCEAAGVTWSVFRGISDHAGAGLVDAELFEMANPDGTSDPDALARYLEAHPEKVEVLTRLGQDLHVATEAAAAAAVQSLTPRS